MVNVKITIFVKVNDKLDQANWKNANDLFVLIIGQTVFGSCLGVVWGSVILNCWLSLLVCE